MKLPEELRPKKSLGQNFLIDENVARKIVQSVEFQDTDIALEIGPGTGVLTKYILPLVKKLIVVELDQSLAQGLREQFGTVTKFHLETRNFLGIRLSDFVSKEEQLRIIGNIPYNITSPVIFKVLEQRAWVRDMTLMVQREVAQRIVASPGNKDYGILSVISQLYSEPRILFQVSKNVFFPKPKVDSTIVHWEFFPKPKFVIEDEFSFRKLIRTVFAHRRKMLRNSLKFVMGADFEPTGIDFDLKKRPEELSVAQFVYLWKLLQPLKSGL
ncbi:MAG: 16S rRNA (adenine(1518)-N(6)/adenine(1519)-N(6))-dimethyltransferase RsmA [candidate division KSB1 bacterium]|nr:16S rRNA (adenine(1518)-N(6)/adenine(1519)-N(6))-dimethyltransferase RsmA [candidate division KSB1 bacterium]